VDNLKYSCILNVTLNYKYSSPSPNVLENKTVNVLFSIAAQKCPYSSAVLRKNEENASKQLTLKSLQA